MNYTSFDPRRNRELSLSAMMFVTDVWGKERPDDSVLEHLGNTAMKLIDKLELFDNVIFWAVVMKRETFIKYTNWQLMIVDQQCGCGECKKQAMKELTLLAPIMHEGQPYVMVLEREEVMRSVLLFIGQDETTDHYFCRMMRGIESAVTDKEFKINGDRLDLPETLPADHPLWQVNAMTPTAVKGMN